MITKAIIRNGVLSTASLASKWDGCLGWSPTEVQFPLILHFSELVIPETSGAGGTEHVFHLDGVPVGVRADTTWEPKIIIGG